MLILPLHLRTSEVNISSQPFETIICKTFSAFLWNFAPQIFIYFQSVAAIQKGGNHEV